MRGHAWAICTPSPVGIIYWERMARHWAEGKVCAPLHSLPVSLIRPSPRLLSPHLSLLLMWERERGGGPVQPVPEPEPLYAHSTPGGEGGLSIFDAGP